MDKVVNDLVSKATKPRPPAISRSKVKEAIRKRAEKTKLLSTGQKRRDALLEKQFQAKADQIAKLTQELADMRALVMQTTQTVSLEEKLKSISDAMVNSDIFSNIQLPTQ